MASKMRGSSALKSVSESSRIVWPTPYCFAIADASGASSLSRPRYSSKRSVIVCRSLAPLSRAIATIDAESMPAERNAPTGTSATM